MCGHKKMYMIRHYFKGKNFNPKLTRFVVGDLLESIFNLTNEYLFAPLGAPYQVVVQKIYMVLVSFVFHVDNIYYVNIECKFIFQRKIAVHLPIKIRELSG